MRQIPEREFDRFDGVPKSVRRRGVLDLGDLPGEETEGGIQVDLIPATMWGENCRSVLTKRQWQYVSDYVRHRAGWQCEFCGAGNDFAAEKWLMAHERFVYDGNTMRLSALICICPKCNDVAHPGRAMSVIGKSLDQISRWYAEVAEIDRGEAVARMSQATKDFNRRSDQEWNLDLTLIAPWVATIGQFEAERSE